MKLVLDTNVVMDLLHFADAAVHPIAAAIAAGAVRCCADALTLEELTRVVTYPEFGLDAAAGGTLLARYRAMIDEEPLADGPPPSLPRCRDPDDQKFLELAARAGADCLITKDKALLRLKRKQGLNFRILTPTEAGAQLVSSTLR